MTSQHIRVAQQFHSEHYVHMLDLLSTDRGWFYGCAQNTQDWLSTSRLTTEITDQGFEAFKSFWFHWLYTGKIGLHTCRCCHSGCLDIDRAFGDTYSRITQCYSLNRLPDTHKYWKNSPDYGFFGLGKISAWEKGDLLRNPCSRATPHIRKSPRFKKGYTYLAHAE